MSPARMRRPATAGAARRAILRWSWRLLRREWRQQVLITTLLTAAVAAAIGLASAAYITAPVPDNAEFGAASHLIRFSAPDPQTLRVDVDAVRQQLDTHEVIYHRQVPVPGLAKPADYRAQDPDGQFSGPRLALLEGMYPTGGQVAITDGIADILHLEVGASLALDGESRTVVGIAENPGNLADEFVLLPFTHDGDADAVTILANSSDDQALRLRVPSGAALEFGARHAGSDVIAAVTVLLFATVALLLIALLAAASFVVIAHRRMRQLGMLAAIGATRKQLRLVTVANGTMIGVIAAVIGAVIGLAGWVAVAPLVEDIVGYRVDELDVPLWLIASGMLLAVVAGTAAAWLPARTVARVPAVRALSGRPPEPKPARRAAALAAFFAAVGVTCLAMVGDLADDTDVTWTRSVLIVAGTVAVAAAMLIASPPAIKLLAASVGRFPVAVRLAIGDLARYRARSGAALAAISLTIAIAVTLVAAATAAQAGTDEGNLPANHVLVQTLSDGPFIPAPADLDRLHAATSRVAASFSDPQVTSLDAALHPASEPDPSFGGREAITLAKRDGNKWIDASLLYAATPQLLAYYGHALGAAAPDTAVITRETGEHTILEHVRTQSTPDTSIVNVHRLRPSYESLPGTFVTTAVAHQHGWVLAPAGRWLVRTSTPPTTDQLATAREIAAAAGLTVEIRDSPAGLGALRTGATAAGLLAALGIVAMTVGLVRSEAGRDLRILTATGATRRTRRTLTAATAAALATLGAILGTTGAYLGLTAGFARNLGALSPVPVAHLAVITFALPLLATLAGWLISGRAVTDIARQPIE